MASSLTEKALKYARRVIEDELEVRMYSFCVKNDDGTYDESVMNGQQRSSVRECRTAISKIDAALKEK